MKVNTSELQGKALDYAVAKCEKYSPIYVYYPNGGSRIYAHKTAREMGCNFNPSTNWGLAGPIIERERLEFSILTTKEENIMAIGVSSDGSSIVSAEGQTYLIAAMRCYVASKLGDTVEVPDELM